MVMGFGGDPHDSHAAVGDVLLAVNGHSLTGMCGNFDIVGSALTRR